MNVKKMCAVIEVLVKELKKRTLWFLQPGSMNTSRLSNFKVKTKKRVQGDVMKYFTA